MQRPCDECGLLNPSLCQDCKTTMICDNKECMKKHKTITCALDKDCKKMYDKTFVPTREHNHKKSCVTVNTEVTARLLKLLGLEEKKIPKYEEKGYLLFGGPISDPVPFALRPIINEPKAKDFFETLKVPMDMSKWYYIIQWEDVPRVLCVWLTPKQQKELFFCSEGKMK
jgi:hypothetical protein